MATKRRGKILGKLTEADRLQVNAQQKLIDEASLEVRMMIDGQTLLWHSLRQKYGVSDNFTFNPKTGIMHEKGKSDA
jgi:hypothetical protein